MASIDLTNRYTNQQKRFAEAVAMVIPSQLEEGGSRLATPPVYIDFADSVKASIIEADTLVKKAYLIIDEAFPAGATITVDIAGTTYFAAAPLDGGLVVSAIEDQHFVNGQTITCTFGGGSGAIMTGVARIVLDSVSPRLKNGNYAASFPA